MDRLTVIIIKDQLRSRGLKQTGNKAELFLRLSEAWISEGKDIEQESRRLEAEFREVSGESGTEMEEMEKGVHPQDSVSQVGSRFSKVSGASVKSNRSALVESRAKAAVRRKVLEIRSKNLQKKNELDKKEASIRQEKEQLEIDTELAEVMAEEDVWNKAEQELIALETGNQNILTSFGKSEDDKVLPLKKLESNLAGNLDPGSNLIPPKGIPNLKQSRIQPKNEGCKVEDSKETSRQRDQEKRPELDKDLVTTLISSNLKALMPRQEIRKFKGEHTEYFLFIKTFDSLIGENLTSDTERLRYLQQYTEGQPRDIVQACMHLDSSEGYRRARDMLDKRYGCKEQIATAYIDKILQWKEIGRDNIEALDEYAVTLFSCKNAVSCVPYGIAELNNPKTLRNILSKLPFSLQEKWRKIADDVMCKNKTVTFDDLVQFIEKEARIAKNPLFGRHLFSNKNMNRMNAQNSQSSGKVAVNTINMKKELECWYCQGSHIIDKCESLRNKNHEEKITIIKELRLCFRCLRKGHVSKECRNRRTCETCNGIHHTFLHKEIEEQSVVHRRDVVGTEDAGGVKSGRVSVYLNTESRVTGCMSVVPVRVSLNGGKQVLTRAFLDNGSAGTFCSNSLLDKLGIKLKSSHKVELSVGTMHGEREMCCSLVDGIQVFDFDGNNAISLPPLYGVEKLPITKHDTFSKNDISHWKHLKNARIPECDEEVELLIGTNAPDALQPWEIVNSDEGKPFAFRTKLGWVVCGKKSRHVDKISVNGLSVREDILKESKSREVKFIDKSCKLNRKSRKLKSKADISSLMAPFNTCVWIKLWKIISWFLMIVTNGCFWFEFWNSGISFKEKKFNCRIKFKYIVSFGIFVRNKILKVCNIGLCRLNYMLSIVKHFLKWKDRLLKILEDRNWICNSFRLVKSVLKKDLQDQSQNLDYNFGLNVLKDPPGYFRVEGVNARIIFKILKQKIKKKVL